MPRKNSRKRPDRAAATARPLGGNSTERVESWRGLRYRVRTVNEASSPGPYRCPGCDQLVAGVTHVVVWPEDDVDANDRRHWHTSCWSGRARREPGVQRSRNAPRYG